MVNLCLVCAGFLALLSQLTKVGDYNEAQFKGWCQTPVVGGLTTRVFSGLSVAPDKSARSAIREAQEPTRRLQNRGHRRCANAAARSGRLAGLVDCALTPTRCAVQTRNGVESSQLQRC